MQRSERTSVSRCTVLYRTVPYRTVLYCTVPYRTVPYCTVPYRTGTCRALFGITDMTLENGCITDNIRVTVFMGTVVMCWQR